MHTVLILCQRRDVTHLVDVLEDWKDDAVILVYGYTNKLQDGFILMHWNQPIPARFQDMQLRQDPGILDYVVYDLTQQPTPTTA